MKTIQFRVRRKFAKVSFVAILLTLVACLLIVVFGDKNTAANLREAGIIIAPIIVCLTVNIGLYMKLVSDADNLHKT